MRPYSSWGVLVPRTIEPLNLLVKTRLSAPSTEGLSGADIILAGNDGQHDVRGVLFPVMDGLPGEFQPIVPAQRRACIRVTIESGEIAAGYLNPQPVARLEKVAGCPEVDNEIIDPAWLHQRGFGPGCPEAPADDAVLDVVSIAVRTNIDQFCSKVGIGRAATSE